MIESNIPECEALKSVVEESLRAFESKGSSASSDYISLQSDMILRWPWDCGGEATSFWRLRFLPHVLIAFPSIPNLYNALPVASR